MTNFCSFCSTYLQVLIITGVGQIRYLNRALMRFDSKVGFMYLLILLSRAHIFYIQVVIPVQFVLFTLSAIIGSAILYGDFRRAKFHEVVTFLYGCAATFLGVFIIAWGPSSESGDPENGTHPDSVNGVSSSHPSRLDLVGRSRGTVVLPVDARNAPKNLSQHSNVSLLGLSPAQVRMIILCIGLSSLKIS